MQDLRREVAIDLVKECGEMLRKQQHHTIEQKDGIHDLVSDMDRLIENYLIDQLSMRYPTDTFLCEESIKESGASTWIIDPIDGTTNFINAHEDFAISIAYYEQLQPVFGIVYDVMKEELFLGIKGLGAWVNDQPLTPLEPKALAESVIDMSMHTMAKLQSSMQEPILRLSSSLRGHRSLGCASLAICHIASGKLDAYLSANVKVWDYAAAWIILQEVQGAAWFRDDFFTCHSSLAMFTCHSQLLIELKEHCFL